MVEGQRNPSFEGSWTDDRGEVWKRKGKRGRVLEDRRIRSLLHREDVPLVVWQSFETFRYDDPPAKEAAALRLSSSGTWDHDVHASEWLADDGRLLLMLECSC
jgi:hypothetical protein